MSHGSDERTPADLLDWEAKAMRRLWCDRCGEFTLHDTSKSFLICSRCLGC